MTGKTAFGRLAVLVFTVLCVLIGATACATRQESHQPPARGDDRASGFPVKVRLPGQEPVTLTSPPENIVSLSPTATETLYAVGAGDQVVAVDRYSNYPERAPQTNMSGLTATAAAVSEYNPDLVIAPDSATELAKGLRAIDIPVLLTPAAADLQAAFDQIEAIGRATGHPDKARKLVENMRAEIGKILANTPEPQQKLTFYHEVSPAFYSATSDSFVGSIYRKFGLTNIADGANGAFPQLSEEHILQANPDLIFLSDVKSGVSAASVAERPGWATLTAVEKGHIYELDTDIASRWGPRLVDLVRAISNAVTDILRK